MKDQYVADFNDYLKYALLRAVSERERLGVVWMLTASDGRKDGGRLRYLTEDLRLRGLDGVVFDALADIVVSRRRTLAAVEATNILDGAMFVSDVLDDSLPRRSEYFAAAAHAVRGCSLVFFDPDNGLAVRSVAKGRRNSSKYLYWDELQNTYLAGKSIVVYQHFPRVERWSFLEALAAQVRAITGCPRLAAVTTSHVAFLVVPQPARAEELEESASVFASRASRYARAVHSIHLSE